MVSLQSLAKRLSHKLKQRDYLRLVPDNHTLQDVFLVSFPKSGNTWFRFLIANAFKVHYGIERDVNFFTIDEIIPGMGMATKNLQPGGIFGRNDLPRFIKSHSPYNPYYCRVFLLVREPKDALVSYFHYQRDRGEISLDMSISEFIRHPKFGVNKWIQHTQSWCSHFRQGQNIQVFTYESFIKDPKPQLARCMELLGIQMQGSDLEKAIFLSSKEQMQVSDKLHRSILVKDKEIPFVRKDSALRGKDLSDEDKKFIADKTRDLAQMFGY
jgi:Sulfotransferase domain